MLERVKKYFRRHNPEYAEEALPCRGCGKQPLVSRLPPPLEDSVHLTCVDLACPSPRWTATDQPSRSREQAVAEWNGLNAE